jgi:hypothetical protein
MAAKKSISSNPFVASIWRNTTVIAPLDTDEGRITLWKAVAYLQGIDVRVSAAQSAWLDSIASDSLLSQLLGMARAEKANKQKAKASNAKSRYTAKSPAVKSDDERFDRIETALLSLSEALVAMSKQR